MAGAKLMVINVNESLFENKEVISMVELTLWDYRTALVGNLRHRKFLNHRLFHMGEV